jgi:predicted outer membrane repeat protein
MRNPAYIVISLVADQLRSTVTSGWRRTGSFIAIAGQPFAKLCCEAQRGDWLLCRLAFLSMRLPIATLFGGMGLVLSCQGALGFDDFTPAAPAPTGGAFGSGLDGSGNFGSSGSGGTLGSMGGASGSGSDGAGASGSSNSGGIVGTTGGDSGSAGASGSSGNDAGPDVTAGSGGSVSTGGSAGSGESMGTGGTAGSGGSVGTGGTAGTGGSAGSEAGTPDGFTNDGGTVACVVHVKDDTGNDSNDGTTWAKAVATVTRGLALAGERVGDSGTATCEVWVTAGLYKPMGTDRTATFQLRSRVGLYGGFQGTETLRKDRNWRTRVTTLSGDLDGNDVSGSLPTGNNAYHVLTSADGAILDGFTVIGGRADVSTGPIGPNGRGGGMLVPQGVPVIRNCTFTYNYAVEGGAIDLRPSSETTIANTKFTYNRALFDGGALQTRGSTTFVNCLFSGNRAEGIGGAVYADAGRVTLHSSTVVGNVADYGDNPFGGSDFWVINSIVWGNGTTRITSNYTITYSTIDFAYAGVGNLSKADGGILDPAFGGSFRLSDASGCLDVGDNNRLPTDKLDLDEDGDTSEVISVDLDGLPRVHRDRVDMGAFENHR